MTARPRSRRGEGETLAEDILVAATDLLIETDSVDAVSVRAVARRVGVTPPSIYLHFADKDALLTAVVARYFAQLDVALRAASEGADATLEKTKRVGLAYVEFALATPELYRLATMTPAATASEVDLVLQASAFAHFTGLIEKLMDEGFYPLGDPVPIALRTLVVVHGVAAMLVAKPFLPWGDPMEFAEQVLTAGCLGLAVVASRGGDIESAAVADLVAAMREAGG